MNAIISSIDLPRGQMIVQYRSLHRQQIGKMRGNQHVPTRGYNMPQPTTGSLQLQNMFESESRNYAYEMMELEMSIETQNSPSVGTNKLEDISKLIQMYMMGVQTLQSIEDQRYQYFSKKLEALMLKKTVVTQLYKGAKSPDVPRKIGEEKRKQHQVHLFYNKQQHQKGKVKQLMANIDKKLEKFSGAVNHQVKTQEQIIQERLRLRKLRSQNGSVSKFNINGSPGQNTKNEADTKLSDLDDLPKASSPVQAQKRAKDDIFQSHKQLPQKKWRDV